MSAGEFKNDIHELIRELKKTYAEVAELKEENRKLKEELKKSKKPR